MKEEGIRKQKSDKALFAHAQELMERHQYYLNPNLTLADIAKKLRRSRTSLSSVINQFAGCNFSVWVSTYRINFFVQDNSARGLNRGDLDFQKYGFASRSSFYRVFKKFKGTTPQEYFDEMIKAQAVKEAAEIVARQQARLRAAGQ
ncbi:MAG: helix-turn-helix transcriptional regulator [Bacteroidaceae bacterium]|nr:helix-turn-helix transcriptional regulator [Bacteroidaceae bacterium]